MENYLGFVVFTKQEFDDRDHSFIGASDATRDYERLIEENRKLKAENKELKRGKYASGFLTTKEAAEYINVAPASMRNMKSSGLFILNRDFVMTGSNRPMYKKDALDAFLNGRRG